MATATYDVYLSLPIVTFDGDEDELDTKITQEWTLLDSDGNTVAIIGTAIEKVDGTNIDAPEVT